MRVRGGGGHRPESEIRDECESSMEGTAGERPRLTDLSTSSGMVKLREFAEEAGLRARGTIGVGLLKTIINCVGFISFPPRLSLRLRLHQFSRPLCRLLLPFRLISYHASGARADLSTTLAFLNGEVQPIPPRRSYLSPSWMPIAVKLGEYMPTPNAENSEVWRLTIVASNRKRAFSLASTDMCQELFTCAGGGGEGARKGCVRRLGHLRSLCYACGIVMLDVRSIDVYIFAHVSCK